VTRETIRTLTARALDCATMADVIQGWGWLDSLRVEVIRADRPDIGPIPMFLREAAMYLASRVYILAALQQTGAPDAWGKLLDALGELGEDLDYPYGKTWRFLSPQAIPTTYRTTYPDNPPSVAGTWASQWQPG